MPRATRHRHPEPSSGLKTPLQTAPLLSGRTQETRRQAVAQARPSPRLEKTPTAFQPGRVAFCTVSMENMPVPAILQPI